MYQKEPILYRSHPFLRLLMLLALVIVSMLVTAFIGILIGMVFYGTDLLESLKGFSLLNEPGQIAMLKYLQIVNQIGLFIIPPFLFALMVSRNVGGYLRINKAPRFYTVLAGSAMVLFSLPFLHMLTEINEMARFPEFMGSIERWLQEYEARARELTEAFIDVDTYGGLAVNLLMIAILPAVGEELLFRGALLRAMNDWTKNIHWAVIITAFLFSALHLQFYGFLPRFVLGILLGYMLVWSGSLWVPIIVHFVNNASAVLIVFFMNRSGKEVEMEEIGSSSNMFIIIFSLLLMVSLTVFIYANEKRKG